MDSSLTPVEAIVAPWRRATLVAVGIAVLELTLVIALAATLLTREDSSSAGGKATTATEDATPKVRPILSRARTDVLVLNGNGQEGAASAQADVVRSLGYGVSAVGNAAHANNGSSTVLYVAGREREARRLAKELGITVVGPLDGLSRKTLQGAHVAVILGR